MAEVQVYQGAVHWSCVVLECNLAAPGNFNDIGLDRFQGNWTLSLVFVKSISGCDRPGFSEQWPAKLS
jgi:hypothetical protein